MGLLVLTRATWSLFPPACLGLVAMLAPARRLRAVLACAGPVLLLQGGWAVKNFAVYGVLSPLTSSWGGWHGSVGLQTAGFGPAYVALLRQRSAEGMEQAEWVIAWLLNDPRWRDHLPAEVREHDAAVERAMGLENSPYNTLCFRTLWQEGQRFVLEFARAHPREMGEKWWRGYQIFWQPISSYGRLFVALFTIGPRPPTGLDLPEVFRELRAGTLPNAHYLMSGTGPFLERKAPRAYTPTSMYTLRPLDPFVLAANVIGVHLLLPLVIVAWLVHRVWRGGRAAPLFDPLRMSALLVAAVVYGYLAAVVNFVETAENMRYRQEVEPVIWLITLICLTELTGLVRPRARRRT